MKTTWILKNQTEDRQQEPPTRTDNKDPQQGPTAKQIAKCIEEMCSALQSLVKYKPGCK